MSGPLPSSDPATNPFSTRYVRPGALPFFFADGQSADALVERLRASGWWGEIVGPHGSGKSALLSALAPRLDQAGRSLLIVELHDGQRRLPPGVLDRSERPAETLLIVDGYEQLSWWSRWRLKQTCRLRGWGLLVATHRPAGLPRLATTRTDLDLARHIVAYLLGRAAGEGGSGGRAARADAVTDQDVIECFASSGGDLREMLFMLYDRYNRPPA
jgi:hypothetical protein